jgi:hypothetical protein
MDLASLWAVSAAKARKKTQAKESERSVRVSVSVKEESRLQTSLS